jgi:hemerythrin superfamily protein
MTQTTTDRQQGVTKRVRRQHERIRQLFAAAGRDTAPGRDAFQKLVWLLSVHETAEEIVIHPAASMLGGDALAAARARKDEERKAKATLAELEELGPGSRGFGAKFAAFRDDVLEHAEAEERDILPVLERRCPTPQLLLMDQMFVGIQLVAPTHAHRFAPVGAIGNLTVGPLIGAMDRFRDLTSPR